MEELAEKIVAAGGKRRMKAPCYYYPGEKPYRMIYMKTRLGISWKSTVIVMSYTIRVVPIIRESSKEQAPAAGVKQLFC